jgi:cytochrome c biogenesis protein CcdA
MEFLAGTITAFGLGLLTAISPCPMATNIAAISYIGRRVGSARQVFLSGLLYALGRTLAYVALGVLLVASALSIPQVSMFLQRYMNLLLGPLLILVAMLLLELLRFPMPGGGVSEKMQRRVDAWGIWGALLLGVVFAMSFCPISAGLFFLNLIPLSIKVNSSVALPSVYGIGTALPVLVFALLIAWSAQSVGKAYNRVAQIEWWARRLTGVLFLLIGFHFTLRHIFDVDVARLLSGQ